MILAVAQLIIGLVLLAVMGDLLVRGAVSIALLARVSTSVVGLTVVAMGTSLPELAVSIGAIGRHAPDIAYGNVVGSCIFNVAVILATVIVIRALPIERSSQRLEYVFMLVVLVLGLVVSADRNIDRVEGTLFLGLLLAFSSLMVWLSRRRLQDEEAREIEEEIRRAHALKRAGKAILLVLVGVAGLAAGAELLVRGGVTVASSAGISERMIGLTVAAMGTSLPELAASAAAARRGEAAIALSNIFGSNIFNILGILGAVAVLFEIPVNPESVRVDNWVMLVSSAAILPLVIRHRTLGRKTGLLLLGGFAVYLGYLIMNP